MDITKSHALETQKFGARLRLITDRRRYCFMRDAPSINIKIYLMSF